MLCKPLMIVGERVCSLSLSYRNSKRLLASSSFLLVWGSVAEERQRWMRSSNVVFRTRCSSGMGFLVIFSVGKDCTCWMVFPIGAPGAPSTLGFEKDGGMPTWPRGCRMPWKGWPPGRCGCRKEAWLDSGTGAEGCCCSICDWGSPRGFMIGDVMGTGGVKFSGIFFFLGTRFRAGGSFQPFWGPITDNRGRFFL